MAATIMNRCYSDLRNLTTYEGRFKYLMLKGSVGIETFGFDRYLNQAFYKSDEWAYAREQVIIRDNGCDLGIPGREIFGRIIIHHLIPITQNDILKRNPKIFDPEYLITTSLKTHNAIHYGDESVIYDRIVERTKNDTCPWR